MSFLIRSYSEKDTEETDVILRAAYRTSFGRKDNLRRYLEIPDCCALVAVENDHVAGFGGIIDYGPFSYIGLMAADPRVQRRGIGKSILDGLQSWAYARKCPTILLSASAAGVHMYEKSGFIHQDRTDLLIRKKAQLPKTEPDISQDYYLQEKDLPNLTFFDKPYFGAERASLLRSYYRDNPSRFLVSRDKEGRINGFLVAQERNFGPWVVNDSDVAEALLSRASAIHLP